MTTTPDRPALDDAALAELGRLLNTYGDWCTLDGEAGARGDEAGMEAARQERAELRRAFFERLTAARAEVERVREERDGLKRALDAWIETVADALVNGEPRTEPPKGILHANIGPIMPSEPPIGKYGRTGRAFTSAQCPQCGESMWRDLFTGLFWTPGGLARHEHSAPATPAAREGEA